MIKKLFIVLFILISVSSTYALYGHVVTNINLSFGNINLHYNTLNPNFILFPTTSNSIGTNPAKYNYLGSRNWLSKNSCNLSYNPITNNVTANWAPDSAATPFSSYINYLKNTAPQPLGNQILNTNLWMHANVTYLLVNSSNQYAGFSNTLSFIIDDVGVSLPPTTFTQLYIQSLVNSGSIPAGIYHISAKVTPIDNKCDFNSDGILNSNERHSAIIPSFGPITTFSDADSDGMLDAIDKCVNTAWNSGTGPNKATLANQFQGCPYNYTIDLSSPNGGCSGAVSFNLVSQKVTYNDLSLIKFIKLDFAPLNNFMGTSAFVLGTVFNINQISTLGSGYYKGKKLVGFLNPHWVDKGYCKLQKNSLGGITPLANCITGPKGENLTHGVSRDYWPSSHVLPQNKNKFITVTCNNGNWTSNSLASFSVPAINTANVSTITSVYKKFKYSHPSLLSKRFEHFKDNGNGEVEDEDDNKKEKIRCNLDSKICKFKIPGSIQVDINLSNISNSTTRSIKIFNESGLVRTQYVDPILIALEAHNFMNFKSKTQILNFVKKTTKLMQKFDIVKNLSYDAILNISTIRITTKNFSDGGRVQNLTIYQKIPKSIASSYDNITFISDGGGQRIVLDKDPIIGWYFNDTNGNTGISYNVSGNTEGGTIIITQEPILFNEGELIINYRQNKTGCNLGEVHLFDLVNIDNSKILNLNTGNYQVCITDLDSKINLLNGNLGSNLLNISSYMTNGNISSNFSQFTNQLQLSVNNNSIYWDLKIGELNPDGNFSCLGSYDVIGSTSLFGDCGFKPQNRIWLHLGADYIPPKTVYKIPYLSHSVQVELIASDNIGGSGLNQTNYCIINNSNACQNLNSFSKYIKPFKLSCPADWSCSRIIKYYSTDLASNNETINEENLYLIDKGSACQSDCTAKPAPNRYLKECRNLNGCFYAKSSGETKLNIGLNVGKACNMKIKDSIVNYNATHQIQCPAGPFKLKQFTNEPLSFQGSNNCKSLIKTPYTIILKGEQLMMNIITCYNY